MSRNDLRSQSLDLLRFPLAVVVMVIHTFNSEGLIIQGKTLSLEDMPILLELNRFIDGFLRGQSVPIYFFISGFVFFLGVELTKEKYIQKLRNRLKTLLIPYIIWNIVAVLILLPLFLPCLSSLAPNLTKARLDFSLPAILETFWDAGKGIFARPDAVADAVSNRIFPQNIPLWFVRDLMIVVLCTPLLYWLLRRTRCYLIGVLGILWFVLDYWDLGHVNQLLTAFFFFMWGAYLSVNKKDMMHEFYRFFKGSMILYPLLALLFVASVHYWPDASDTIKRMNIVVGLFFAYNAASWLLRHEVCRVSPFLAASSFFVYVTHTLICGNLLRLLFLIIRPATDLGLLSLYLLTIVLTLTILLSVFYLLRRYSPTFLKVIAGRK